MRFGWKESASTLLKFIISSRAFCSQMTLSFMASGLYVLGAIYDYHRSLDPVYFKANELFQAIPQLVESCIGHRDPMVARRAQMTKNLVDNIQAAA